MMESYEIIIIYIFSCVLVIPLIIVVNKKLYLNIKNEEHLEKGKVIQQIMKTYALLQCLIWPVIVIAYGLIKLIGYFSLNLYFKTSVSIFRFLYTIFRDYLQFHSLVISICRYIFIVWESTATRFGIQKIRSYVTCASVLIPFVTAVLYELTCPIEKTFIHWFYGDKGCDVLQNETKNETLDLIESDCESATFKSFNKIFSSSMVQAISIIENVLFSIIYSNVIEGFIYIHIFIWFQQTT